MISMVRAVAIILGLLLPSAAWAQTSTCMAPPFGTTSSYCQTPAQGGLPTLAGPNVGWTGENYSPPCPLTDSAGTISWSATSCGAGSGYGVEEQEVTLVAGATNTLSVPTGANAPTATTHVVFDLIEPASGTPPGSLTLGPGFYVSGGGTNPLTLTATNGAWDTLHCRSVSGSFVSGTVLSCEPPILNYVAAPTWIEVAHTSEPGTSADSTTTTAINTVGSNLIIVAVADAYANPIGTLTDSAGNTWGADTVSNGFSPAGNRIVLYYLYNPITSTSDTFTYSAASSAYAAVAVEAWVGAGSSPLDQTNSSTSNSSNVTSLACGSITPVVNNELIFSAISFGAAYTSQSVNTGSLGDSVAFSSSVTYGLASAYYNQTTAGAINSTYSWTDSAQASCAVMSFKPL